MYTSTKYIKGHNYDIGTTTQKKLYYESIQITQKTRYGNFLCLNLNLLINITNENKLKIYPFTIFLE